MAEEKNWKEVFSYHSFEIPKKSGGTRAIEAPSPELKAIQRSILDDLVASKEKELSPSNLAYGFVPGCSIKDNASRHCGKKYVLNMDIKDFFPTCVMHTMPKNLKSALETAMQALEKEGKIPSTAVPLGQTLFNRDALPQGSPTSPYISNLFLKKFDCVVIAVLRRCVSTDIIYTRYADDMTFSSNSRAIARAPEIVAHVLSAFHFKVNAKKTRIASRNKRQEVTGLNINAGKPTISQKYRKRVRAILHRAAKCGWIMTKDQAKVLGGMVAHIHTCHPEEAIKYREQMAKIVPVKYRPKRLVNSTMIDLDVGKKRPCVKRKDEAKVVDDAGKQKRKGRILNIASAV